VGPGTHATVNGQTYAYDAVAERIFLSCDHGSWDRSDLSFTTSWYIDGDGANDTPGNGSQFAGISPDEGPVYDVVSNSDTLRLNFQPGTQQQPSVFYGTVTCVVTATTSKGGSADASSVGATVWNGCDIGIEQWDQKVTLTGPLCGDYESGYAPPGCSLSDVSACFSFLWRESEFDAASAPGSSSRDAISSLR